MELRKLERMDELKSSIAVKEEPKKVKVVEPTENVEKEKLQKQVKSKISKAENDIEVLEKQIADWDTKLSDTTFYAEMTKDPNLFNNYNATKAKLDAKMKEWEDLCEELKNV